MALDAGKTLIILTNATGLDQPHITSGSITIGYEIICLAYLTLVPGLFTYFVTGCEKNQDKNLPAGPVGIILNGNET